MNKRRFLDEVIPKLRVLEARADGVLPYEEAKRIRKIAEPIRAMVCEITDAMDRGEEVSARIKEVRLLIKLAL